MGVTLPSTSLRLGLKTRLGRKICLPVLLGAAAVVALLQHGHPFHNHFSVSLRSKFQPTVSLASASPHINDSSETILMGNFCVGKNCTGIIPKKEDIATLSDYDYVGAANGETDEDFQLPTRPRFKNENLYQKDATQQLNSTWVRGIRVCNFKTYKQYT